VKVDAGGVGTLAGSLADGTKLSAKVPLSKDGLWPVYTSLYHSQGFLAGWLTLTNHSTNDISGESRWARPASAKGKYYPWGFTNSLQVVGSGYLRPPASPPGSAVLTPPTGVIAFGGGNIASPFTNQIALDQKNKVLNLSPNKLSLTISLSSGLFSGRVVDPATGKSSSFKGALLQTQNVGAGFLLGTNCSARVSLGF